MYFIFFALIFTLVFFFLLNCFKYLRFYGFYILFCYSLGEICFLHFHYLSLKEIIIYFYARLEKNKDKKRSEIIADKSRLVKKNLFGILSKAKPPDKRCQRKNHPINVRRKKNSVEEK